MRIHLLFFMIAASTAILCNTRHAEAACELGDSSVVWVSTDMEGVVGVGQTITVAHTPAQREELTLELDGEMLSAVRTRASYFAQYSVYRLPERIGPGTYDLRIHLLTEFAEDTYEQTITVVSMPQVTTLAEPVLVGVEPWVRTETPCATIYAHAFCPDHYQPDPRSLEIKGNAVAYTLERKDGDDWVRSVFIWPATCSPILEPVESPGCHRIVAFGRDGEERVSQEYCDIFEENMGASLADDMGAVPEDMTFVPPQDEEDDDDMGLSMDGDGEDGEDGGASCAQASSPLPSPVGIPLLGFFLCVCGVRRRSRCRFAILACVLGCVVSVSTGCVGGGSDEDVSGTTAQVNNNNQTGQEDVRIEFCGVSDSLEGCEQMGCDLGMLGYHGRIVDEACQLEDPSPNASMLCYAYVSGSGNFVIGNAFTLYVREDEDGYEVIYANADYSETLTGWEYCYRSDVSDVCQTCPESLQSR